MLAVWLADHKKRPLEKAIPRGPEIKLSKGIIT
jgi:hypothetical protein